MNKFFLFICFIVGVAMFALGTVLPLSFMGLIFLAVGSGLVIISFVALLDAFVG